MNTPRRGVFDVLGFMVKYISIQDSIVEELRKRSIDVWECHELSARGWHCESHGEHVFCCEEDSGARIEIPLLTPNYRGIDAGHFLAFLRSIGESVPTYAAMHELLEGLEGEGILIQVQKGGGPIVWDFRRRSQS